MPSTHDVSSLVAEAAADRGEALALVESTGRSVTWGVLEDEVARVATGLGVAGVVAGQRVLLAMGNRIEFVTAYLQSEELGAPMVQTLNQIAGDMRKASAQRQRRKAARVAPRVTLVNSLVLVPGTLIILLTGLLLGSGVDFGTVFGGIAK